MLTKKLLAIAVVAAGLAVTGSAAFTQSAGEIEFMNGCAACHGESGMGDGNIARLMSVEVPDLTTLSQKNDGEFPMLEVIHVIDGRTGVRGHGSDLPGWVGGMPIWGDRFEAAATQVAGDYGAELIVRGRILSLANYLESIQK